MNMLQLYYLRKEDNRSLSRVPGQLIDKNILICFNPYDCTEIKHKYIIRFLLLFIIIIGAGIILKPLTQNISASDPLSNDLMGYWKMDDGSGGKILDSSGNNKTAWSSYITWTSGVIGGAVSFNGTNSYTSLPIKLQTPGQTTVKNPSTVSIWFNPKVDLRTTPQGILSSDDGDSCGSLRIESSSKRLYLSQRCFGFPYIDISNDDWTNKWVNLVITIDSSGEKAYINGVQRALIGLGSQNINWVVANIGRRNANGSYLYFNGLVDEVRVYNRVLSASEVQQLYSLVSQYPIQPDAVSGCAVWLKADSGVTPSSNWGKVSSWTNQCPGSSFSQPNSTLQPTYFTNVINAKPAVYFDGETSTNTLITPLLSPAINVHTVFVVADWKGSLPPNGALDNSFPAVGGLDTSNGSNNYSAGNLGAFLSSSSNTSPNFGASTIIPQNPQQQDVFFIATQQDKNVTNVNKIIIGQRDPFKSNWNGYIAELIIYNRVLNPTEITQVQSYLAAKYGINTPSSTPKLSDNMQKGISFFTWNAGAYSQPSADQAFNNLAATNANWIALIATGFQDNYTTTNISITTAKSPTDADLIHVIAEAHSKGVRVMLKPHIDLNDQNFLIMDEPNWTGDIGKGFNTESQWADWFTSYKSFILHYAQLAQDNGVEQFSIGTELSATQARTNDWVSLIAAIRNIYKGPITYAALGNSIQGLAWWDKVDYIGIDFYYPLTNHADPSVSELKTAWLPYLSTFARLYDYWHKPILLTEIGYRSVAGANQIPNRYNTTGPADMLEQANDYEAAFESINQKFWFAGLYIWDWGHVDPNRGGPCDIDYTPYGKPAENILRSWFGATKRSLVTSC